MMSAHASSDGRPPAPWLDARFDLTARGTTVRREILAGATTFVTMAYILFVNPQILGVLRVTPTVLPTASSDPAVGLGLGGSF